MTSSRTTSTGKYSGRPVERRRPRHPHPEKRSTRSCSSWKKSCLVSCGLPIVYENRRSHQLAPFVRQKPRSMSVMAILRQLTSVLYDPARDSAQGFSLFSHSNRDSSVCFCTPDFYSQILSVGTVLSAASPGSRKEPVVGSCRDGAKYSFGGGHVAHSRSCNRSQWPDPAPIV